LIFLFYSNFWGFR